MVKYPPVLHKHALKTLEELMGYQPVARHCRWNQMNLRGQFQRSVGRKCFGGNVHGKSFCGVGRHTGLLVAVSSLAESMGRMPSHLDGKDRTDGPRAYEARCMGSFIPPQEQMKVKAFFRRHSDHFVMHHRVKELPRRNNQAENLNKQLERRFKTIEALQRSVSAIAYGNLLIVDLGQKPYTDCRGARKLLIGKSRLEAKGGESPLPNLTPPCYETATR